MFTRTNRVRGQQRWENELRNFIAAARDLRLQRFAATSDSAPTDLEAQRSLAGDADYSSFYQRRVEVLTQLSKELLYSGIPEQVVQLYVAYQDSLPHIHPESDASPANSSDSVDAGAFAPDLKLVMVTARAFVALSDVDGALKLLRSCARAGTDLNPDYKTQLMAELAEHSAEGLQVELCTSLPWC